MVDESRPPNGTEGESPSGPRVIPLWKQRNFLIGAGVILLIVLGAVAAVALTGDDDEDAAPATSSPTTGTTSVPTTEPGEEPPIAPLTGLPDDTLETLARPALLAKIDNVNLAERPDQAGIEVADVVWQEPVEGGLTRLLAVWHSHAPDRIGPIRSTRFIDPGLVWPFGEVPYVYSGGTPEKVAAIQESPVQTFDETALVAVDAQVRDPSFEAPHNLFAVTDNVWAAANDRTPPEPLFAFLDEGEVFDGEVVDKVEFATLSRATYTWDATRGGWLREGLRRDATNVEPHLTESGEQVAPTNLIVQRINGLGRDDVLGEGDAWVFSQGRMVVVRWEREALEDRTVFRYEDGTEVELTPGSTWIHLILEGEPLVLPVDPSSP